MSVKTSNKILISYNLTTFKFMKECSIRCVEFTEHRMLEKFKY